MEGASTLPETAHTVAHGFLQLVSWLPDDMLLKHVLETLSVGDRSNLRATCKRAQSLANLAVKSIHITAADVPSSTDMLLRFPCATALRLSDNTQTPLNDTTLADLLHTLQHNRPSVPLHARASLDITRPPTPSHHYTVYGSEHNDLDSTAPGPQRRAFRSHTSHAQVSPRSTSQRAIPTPFVSAPHSINADSASRSVTPMHSPSSSAGNACILSEDSCGSGDGSGSFWGAASYSSSSSSSVSRVNSSGSDDSGSFLTERKSYPCPSSALPFTSLDVKQCHYLTNRGMAGVVKACGKLTHVRPSRWVDTPSLMELSRLTRLTHLDLGDSRVDVHSINDASLSLISTCMPGLVSLGLSKCVLVTDTGLSQLSSLRNLTELLLPHTRVSGFHILPTSTTAADGSSNSGVWRPVGTAPLKMFSLQRVDLTGCSNVRDPDLLMAVESGFLGVDLRELRLEGTRVRSAGWAAVAKLLPGIQTLHFGSGFEVNDACWRALGSASQLEHLTVGNFNLTSGARQEPEAADRFQRLKQLQFGGMFASLGMTWVLPLPVLSSLSLTGMDAVTDVVISDLVTRQTSLESLQLTSGYSLTPAGLSQLQRMPFLRNLTLASCPAITPTHLRALLEGSESLQSVRLCRGLQIGSGSDSGNFAPTWELSRADLREEARLQVV